jgi:hypothetical protein
MGRCRKIYERARASPANLRFEEACRLAECFGFQFARQRGTSHRIYKYPGWVGLLNFQSENGEAKSYQVKQLLEAVEELSLVLGPNDLE